MENVKEIILSRFGCSEQDAVHIVSMLENMDKSLVTMLENWVANSNYSSTEEYAGYSVDSLQRDYGMNFVAALLTIDWIIKDPKQAIPALEGGIM